MEDICKKNYAGFLEKMLEALVEMPIEGLCVIGKMKGGATFVNYYKSSMADKILYVGLIQQDATLGQYRTEKSAKYRRV